jgi:hypothetical protein
MKLMIFALMALMLGYYSTFSQTLTINRTDIPNPKADYVTATYTFSFEIILEGLKNSNSVSFKLNYDHSDFVKFSQWKRGDYDVLQAVNFENGDGTASLIIGVSSGLIPQDTSNPTPKVIELEFVVSKDAPDLEKLTMTFERPVATALDSTGGEKIPVTAESLVFTLHSYVNVWPGDSDNNGIVEHLDFAPVSQFIGMGTSTKGIRSFRRPNASALWVPQRVLTWDSALVTYVDCDGNADITTTDLLIVTYNLGKTTDDPFGGVTKVKSPEISKNNNTFASSDLIVIPLNIDDTREFTGVAGSIEVLENGNNFKEISIGNILPVNSYVHYYKKDSKVNFVISNPDLDNNLRQIGKLLNVEFEKNSTVESQPQFIIKELNAIDRNGNIFELKTNVTSVNDADEGLTINYYNDFVQVTNSEIINRVVLIDLMGNCISNNNNQNKTAFVDVSKLQSGIYFLKIYSDNKEIIKKISIIK